MTTAAPQCSEVGVNAKVPYFDGVPTGDFRRAKLLYCQIAHGYRSLAPRNAYRKTSLINFTEDRSSRFPLGGQMGTGGQTGTFYFIGCPCFLDCLFLPIYELK